MIQSVELNRGKGRRGASVHNGKNDSKTIDILVHVGEEESLFDSPPQPSLSSNQSCESIHNSNDSSKR